jgi:hypothetical protein
VDLSETIIIIIIIIHQNIKMSSSSSAVYFNLLCCHYCIGQVRKIVLFTFSNFLVTSVLLMHNCSPHLLNLEFKQIVISHDTLT